MKTVDEVMEMVAGISDLDAIRAELENWQKEITELRNDSVNGSELFMEKQIQLRHADEKIAELLTINKQGE